MKDAAPRIFRSLERSIGQGQFDTVVAAAVAAYGSLRQPSAAQAEDLARLVLPLWARVSADTRRNLAAVLSHAARVPRSLVEALVAEPIEVSAPFLVSSPTLTVVDIARLAASPDERVARLVKNRIGRDSGTLDAVDASPAPDDGAGITPPSLAADFLGVTPLAPERDAAAPDRIAAVRETLRRLALTGRAAPAPSSFAADAPPTFSGLLAAAMERDDARFYRILAAIFGLDDATLAAIVQDEAGERLAVALKALKASAADAMSILMMMKSRIGLDVAAFDSLARFYRALKPEDCRAAIGAARPAVQPRHIPHTAPERSDLPAALPRREFGRRQSRPREAKG